MLHGATLADATLKQAGLNTFSVAGGTHGNIIASMHRPPPQGLYTNRPSAPTPASLPGNSTLDGIDSALAAAHGLYGSPNEPTVRGTCTLMPAQPRNVNIADERPIEHALWVRAPPIPAFRAIFPSEVLRRTHLAPSRALLFTPYDHALEVRYEVAVVYHRAGYEPVEYATDEDGRSAGRDARLRMERSREVQCPPVGTHLATLKPVQRTLARPGAVEWFLPMHEAESVRQTFVQMIALDEPAAADIVADEEQARGWVRKRGAREGGGHNVCRGAIPAFVDALGVEDRGGYLLMEAIEPPREVEGVLVLPDGGVVEGSVVGVFGMCVWRQGAEPEDERDPPKVGMLMNQTAGWSFKRMWMRWA
ncbi:hypothetical protein B0H10DRAFT_2013603 [Mycena sp. CBHHK59/15]|nr:hypothetical protein B0H10DRAFT_2013603 [Mycena sp. CBHHK59/15]